MYLSQALYFETGMYLLEYLSVQSLLTFPIPSSSSFIQSLETIRAGWLGPVVPTTAQDCPHPVFWQHLVLQGAQYSPKYWEFAVLTCFGAMGRGLIPCYRLWIKRMVWPRSVRSPSRTIQWEKHKWTNWYRFSYPGTTWRRASAFITQALGMSRLAEYSAS